MASGDNKTEEFTPKCWTHSSELLPLFCRDCDRVLCSDCVTGDHVGHKLCKVSEVAVYHKNGFEKILECDKTMSRLEEILHHSQQEQKDLAEHAGNLICNVLDREMEVGQRLKLWSKKMVEDVTLLKERHDMSLKEDEYLASAVLERKERKHETESDSLSVTYLHSEIKRLLTSKTEIAPQKKISEKLRFEAGPPVENLDTGFGKLKQFKVHCQENLSDEINEGDHSNTLEDGDNLNEGKTLHDVFVYQPCGKGPIDDIAVFDEHKIFVVSQGTLYQFIANRKDVELDPTVIAKGVYQIAPVLSSRDLLFITYNGKEIKRLSNKSAITTFTLKRQNYDYSNEQYLALNSDIEAYICVLWSKEEKGYQMQMFISLLDEYGVNLMNISCVPKSSHWKHRPRIIATCEPSSHVIVYDGRLEAVGTTPKRIHLSAYAGSVGVNPTSQFAALDLTIDSKGNILLAEPNDNAIHLLDKSLKFKRLLLTEEDGLTGPRSVTLDPSGYLWVGCSDGQIRVFNYQYLMCTDRKSRYLHSA